MIQIPLTAIYALIAIAVAGIIICAIIYHYRKVSRVRQEVERDIKQRLTKIEIEGNVLQMDGRQLKLRRFQEAVDYDLMKVEISGNEDLFDFWHKEAVEKLKREMVQRLPFEVDDTRVEGTNIRTLTITAYIGIEQ